MKNKIIIAQSQINQTLFTTQTPAVPNWSDGVAYELGMKFKSDRNGQIIAIRYWKAASETGTHVGKIWAADGTQLTTVSFSNETASGWQEQSLATPLNIAANTTYVVSVNCNSHFPSTLDNLATSIVNGDLKSVADGNNGVYGSTNSFPTNSYRNNNYYRDIRFAYTPVPTITKINGDNQNGTPGTALPNPLVVKVEDDAGNPQLGVTVNFAVTAGGGSVSSASAVTGANGEASTVLTLGALPSGSVYPVTNTVSATASGISNVSFTALANPSGITYQSVFTTQTPAVPDWTDGIPYELGMKFRSDRNGQILAIRYFKPVSEVGTHVGKIWTADGTVLASATFSGETASGWQKQLLDTPLNIVANVIYVVSVNCNSYFPSTLDNLASSIVNGNLSSVADGNNGVYAFADESFPTNSYRNNNYYRDVVFVAGSTLGKVSGDNQIALEGTTLPNPLVAKVLNGAGNPLAGVTVNFAVTSGSGSVSPTSAVTDANGQVSTVLTLGAIPLGPNNAVIVTATANGIGSTLFNAKAVPTNSNATVVENLKAGNSLGTDWSIGNSSEIVGYAGANSVNKGGALPIKVSLAQPGQFSIEVYRLGFYRGIGARLILNSGSLNGITQPACTTDPNTRLVECNWSTSYTLTVGGDWISGLYVAKLIDQASGKSSLVSFVVRDDSRTSDILFQSSFNTFSAYNNAGGYSLYEYNSINGQRAFKVSYDRIFAGNDILFWEYNMVRWLESQGYDVTYVTNVDVHSNPQLLQQHKVFLSVGHDEYWSMEQRNNVEQARNGNPSVNLAFFSANSCYWRIRFENSSTQQANRIIACYKAPGDPVAPTVRFRDSAINKPENALLGVMYTGYNDTPWLAGYDFVVTNSADSYYAYTNLKDGDKLTMLVGYEWDAIISNGSSPSGLVKLSQSSVNPADVDDALPPGTNTQISNAVRYTAPSGAKVFSTGSVQWMWGLDSHSITPPRTNIRVQQMTVNVLASMDARPTMPDANIIVP